MTRTCGLPAHVWPCNGEGDTRRAFVSLPGLRRVGLRKDAMLSRGVVPCPCPAPLSIAFHTHIHGKHTLFNVDACQYPPVRWLLIPGVVESWYCSSTTWLGPDIGERRQPLVDPESIIKQCTPSVALQTHTQSRLKRLILSCLMTLVGNRLSRRGTWR